MTRSRIYLDNAATTWPKPERVYEAVAHAMRQLGAPAGRSGYREAAEVARLIGQARRGISELLGVGEPQRIVFTCNGTDSLNIALHGLLRAGDHVVTSVVEHNSVLRPLRHLEAHRGIQVTRVESDRSGVIRPEDVESALRPETRLIVLIHASNVTGAIQPVEEVGRICRRQGAHFLVDAAQSLGHLPTQVEAIGCDLLAAPGHKGLLGPLGVGLLYVGPGMEDLLSPLRQGGTGTQSEMDWQPDSLPDKFECGNHNVPAILGLKAGVDYLRERTLEAVRDHEQRLTARLLEGLSSIHGVTLLGPADARARLGVVSITLEGYDSREVASMLDSAYSIQVRSGFHCAPLMHRALETTQAGGAVRFSFGPFNEEADVDAVIQAGSELAETAV